VPASIKSRPGHVPTPNSPISLPPQIPTTDPQLQSPSIPNTPATSEIESSGSSQATTEVATPNLGSSSSSISAIDHVSPASLSSRITVTFNVPPGLCLQPAGGLNAQLNLLPSDSTSQPSSISPEDRIASWEERRDRRRKRVLDSLDKDALPSYKVKRSRQYPLQQSGLQWLTQAGKHKFDGYLAKLLGQWGVKKSKSTDSGPCVLYPADWAALNPTRLAALFKYETCPLEGADGIVRDFFGTLADPPCQELIRRRCINILIIAHPSQDPLHSLQMRTGLETE
jgi:hypothetical protein